MEDATMLTSVLKYRIQAVARTLFIAGCLTAVTLITVAQEAPAKVATAQLETLLQTTQSWNGKPYTHYPTGQPQLTTLEVTIAAHTSLPWHCIANYLCRHARGSNLGAREG
jgi:hypothetical protein